MAEENKNTTEDIQVVEEQQALENFEWDTTGEGDFFGIAGTGEVKDEVAEVVEQIKSTDSEEVVTAEEAISTTEEEDIDFFNVSEDENEQVQTTEVTAATKESGTEEDYKSLTSKLKDKGVFQNIEIPEEEEITEDKFFEYHDQEIEGRVDEAFEGFFSELDEDAVEFLKFKKDGGDTKEFFKTYSPQTERPVGDIDDEAYQEKLSRYYYKKFEGDDSEDIDDKIEWLKDSGKLEKFAQKFDQKITNSEKKAKEDLVKAQADAAKNAEEGRKAFTSSVQKALQETDKVDNFKFTPKSKKSLLPFITRQSVKVGKNTYITPMQEKLSTALKNPEKMLVLAQLLQNDFDVSELLDDATTSATKKLKNNIQRQRTTVSPRSSGKVGKKRSLTDFF